MPSNSQEILTSWLWRFAGIFFFFYITTLTFEYYLIEWWFNIIAVPFRWMAEQSGMFFFGVNLLGADEFYSDSLLVFVHVFDLALIAFVIATFWTIFSDRKFTDTKFHPLLFTLLRYFVALNLLVYGFSKLYKWQFMLPEPNILYTKVGDMHRDILYWTSMGSSRSYTMFMGVIEIVPAILLLFRRTTLIGAFVAALVMTNVVAVNFGFDITVKLHSIMLLIMSLVILIPGRKRIVALFTGKAVEEWKYPAITLSTNRKWILPVLKVAAIAFLIAESHYPYTKTGTYNDDVSERPPMHGVYEVISANATFNGSITGGPVPNSISRIYIHRRGYVIFENADGRMFDYPMSIDTVKHIVSYGERREHLFTWIDLRKDTLNFYGYLEQNNIQYKVKKLDWEKLPLMREEFTLIDEE
jgi:uncharacterized membrane protein YphA (DoxX/SURF4 family)